VTSFFRLVEVFSVSYTKTICVQSIQFLVRNVRFGGNFLSLMEIDTFLYVERLYS